MLLLFKLHKCENIMNIHRDVLNLFDMAFSISMGMTQEL